MSESPRPFGGALLRRRKLTAGDSALTAAVAEALTVAVAVAVVAAVDCACARFACWILSSFAFARSLKLKEPLS